ncbi:hypothetical protein V1478_016168, partial [Vespula squamosa]
MSGSCEWRPSPRASRSTVPRCFFNESLIPLRDPASIRFKIIEELFLRPIVVQRFNVFLTDVKRFPLYVQGPSKYGGY